MQISLITFFITGFVFCVLSIPFIRRKVKINSWYGIRLPKTMESKEVWYEVNAVMGRYMFGLGLLISCLSLYFMLNPTDPEFLMVYILLFILIAGTILFVILSFRISDKVGRKYSK